MSVALCMKALLCVLEHEVGCMQTEPTTFAVVQKYHLAGRQLCSMTKVRRTSTDMAWHGICTQGKPRHNLGFALCSAHTVLLPGGLQAVSDTPEGLPREDEEQGSSCPASCKPAQQGRQPA